ncbi:conjugal transfer protein [Pandoraea cepalis]|uniref:Conjugal transfer protein n=1 Tax=Pandoraea cepalis TaxID=2508294 RepID=A0AAW7MGT4_9BURK|nr:conjugal transfer protein [Pandoraea cepalis]MDN4571860.1 conjugal transfer protein [Pandoraea cepalis]MDN4581314.1 conjugal transfer protein [Pandoraea cepalis]
MKRPQTNAWLFVAAASLAVSSASAEDLGSKSQTYALDRDASEQIKDVMRKKQANGELDRFWKDYRDRTIASIKNPASLGIKSDYTNSTELRALKFSIPNDYKDQTGKVIVKRGTIVEPLKIMPLTTGLIFIDGNDPQQVAYAIKRSQTESLKIVLTAGSPYSLRVKYREVPWHGGLGVPFYFDQRKMIINSLSMLYGIEINRVPVTLSQRGDKLAIEFGMGGGN